MALVTTAECRLFLCRALFFQCVHDLVIHHLVGVIAVVGKDGDAAVRESVTLTRDGVMDELAADFAGDMLDDAALFAKFSKENRTAAQKLLDSLKEFLNKVRGLFTGKYRDMAAQEAYGKDFAELEDISKQWQAAFDAAERQAEKAKTAAGEGDGARYSLKKSGIDKYYARQIDQWDGKDHGGAFRVGAVSDALLKVGVPDVDIWFDQSKAAKQLEGKSKITKDVLKQIPEVLESPVAISESYDNTVMVFGQLFDGGGNPIVVAIRISSTNRRNHISIVNKSRSVGTRSHNLDALLADDKLLYLGENKKETKKWFNALGRSTPFGGTKFGLIRSISNPVENVKPKFSLGYLKSDVGFFCFRVFEKGGCSKVLCGVFSFRAVRGKAVAVKFYVGFPIRSDLCRKRHRHLTEDADAFLLECSGNQLNNSSSFCWSVPSLAYGSASNCRKLCLMSFVSSLKPRMYESAM